MNTDNIGTDSGNDLQNPLPSLLVALNGLFLDLETSICELHTTLNVTLRLFINFIVKILKQKLFYFNVSILNVYFVYDYADGFPWQLFISSI